MSNLVKRVQNTIFQNKLFDRGDKVILAVSGGPDSVTLLNIFSKLQDKYDLELAIVHVNYGLRGKDSNEDEKLVRDLAGKYGFEIFIHRPEIKKNFSENHLRSVRYDFFEQLRKEKNFNLIAVAHNQDDQVETFLLRIIRGAGMQGLSAMRYKNGRIIRPLLDISRQDIEKYLHDNKLSFRIDKSNLESKYSRNKIRNQLLPYLEKNFNPQIRQTIFSSVRSIADDYALISQMATETYEKHRDLSIKDILQLPVALQKRVILAAIMEKRSNLEDIESAHVNEIMKIISSTKNKKQKLEFKGLMVIRRGDKLKIESIK